MKIAVVLPFASAALALPSTPALQFPSNISLASDLPDASFNITQKFDSPFLPVNATLLNVLHFMGTVARKDFHEQLAPRTYSAPGNRQVQITTFAWTEVRFLLWGIYNAVTAMMKSARFHNTLIDLHWRNQFVGRISIMIKPGLSLPGAEGYLTTSGGNDTATLSAHDDILAFPKYTLSNSTANNDITDDLSLSWDAPPPANLSTFPTISSSNATVESPSLAIELHLMAGARPLSRNDVFLTFYTGILHAAQHDMSDELVTFESQAPGSNMWLDMYAIQHGCTYGGVLDILVFVPKAMAEKRAFGYTETTFTADVDGRVAYGGSISKGFLAALDSSA